jgi:hypothetical protein
MRVIPQSEQYGLPYREASKLPPAAEVADLLAGHRIMPGLPGHGSVMAGTLRPNIWNKFGDPGHIPGTKNQVTPRVPDPSGA